MSRHAFRRLRDCLARAKVCHETLVDLAGEEAFEAQDDLTSGPTVRGPSGDAVDGRLVVTCGWRIANLSRNPLRFQVL